VGLVSGCELGGLCLLFGLFKSQSYIGCLVELVENHVVVLSRGGFFGHSVP
jgi:hypothetical protein